MKQDYDSIQRYSCTYLSKVVLVVQTIFQDRL